MRVANEVSPLELDLVISQFVDDFQSIIRRQVEHAVKKALAHGPRKAALARAEREKSPARKKKARSAPPSKRRALATSSAPEKSARESAAPKRKGRKRATHPGQLSLF
ncbi:MAG TPA: hypothetical protein VG937_12800 [Polyangiaceae bacterium]|jgi:hypothetical protein|nr:hypothetical protein [Polyangiaceae bacterium]